MTIKTTRLRNSQVPQNKVYDLSPQCDGVRQVFTLPKRVFPSDKCYLILNGRVIRNDLNHTFFTYEMQGTKIHTYFQTAPTGTDVLQFVRSDNSEGVEPFATEEYADAAANTAKQAAIATAKDYTDDEIDTLDTTLRGLVTSEASTRAAADTALGGRVDTEATNRANADTALQQEIDAIIAKSDVVDIVGTYAELMEYDTSELGDNDKIKVLADETHSGAISYYNWDKPDEEWEYIGSEGPYLTPSAAASTYVPLTRTINGKALSANISLDAEDVGAAEPDDIPTKTSDLANDGSDGVHGFVSTSALETVLEDYYTKDDADEEFATKEELADVVGDIGQILDNVHSGNIVIIESEV